MALGHRVYILENGGISRMTQRAFDEFYFRRLPVLPRFAGQAVDIATVYYKLKNRKPVEIVQIDVLRHRVTENGALDPEHEREAARLFVNRIDLLFGAPESSQTASGVVDAAARFEARRLRAKHRPELSGPVHRMILDDLFGRKR